MTDTLMTIIGIFIAVVLMFLFPLIEVAGKNDDISQTVIQIAAANFVNEVSKEGKITRYSYDELVTKAYSTGNTYDIIIEARILDDNPERRTITTEELKPTEGQYYSVYTNTILEKMEQKEQNGEVGEYLLKKDDYILVTIKNNNITLGSQLKGIFYKFLGKDTYSIGANASALVINTGEIEKKELQVTYVPIEEPYQDINTTINLNRISQSAEAMSSFNLVYMIDYSGSMGENIDNVSSQILKHIRSLRDKCISNNNLSFNISVVAFGSGAGEIIRENINSSITDAYINNNIGKKFENVKNLWHKSDVLRTNTHGFIEEYRINGIKFATHENTIAGLALPRWYYQDDYDINRDKYNGTTVEWQDFKYLKNDGYKYSFEANNLINHRVNGLKELSYIGGSTSYSNALKVGSEVLQEFSSNGNKNYAIFLTDGMNNDGVPVKFEVCEFKIGAKGRSFENCYAMLRGWAKQIFILKYNYYDPDTQSIDYMKNLNAVVLDANNANLDIEFDVITGHVTTSTWSRKLRIDGIYELEGINPNEKLLIKIEGVTINPNEVQIELAKKTDYNTGDVQDAEYITYNPADGKYYLDTRKMKAYFQQGYPSSNDELNVDITLTYYSTV